MDGDAQARSVVGGRPRHNAGMVTDSGIPVPPTFVALHLQPGRSKPDIGWAEMAARHEFCDDLAQMLMDRARHTQWNLGLDEHTVLERLQLALTSAEQPVVNEREAWWVTCRLAELLAWPMPEAVPDWARAAQAAAARR